MKHCDEQNDSNIKIMSTIDVVLEVSNDVPPLLRL